MPQVVFSFFNLQGRISQMKVSRVSQWNEMKSFGEKLIEVANVSYLSYCKLNSIDPDVKKGWSWTWSRWWSMDWGSVKCI